MQKTLKPKMKFRIRVSHLLVCMIAMVCISCGDTRKAVYFANQGDSAQYPNLQPPLSVIQNNDLLSINVSGRNNESTDVFNYPNRVTTTVSSASGGQLQVSGYLVNTEGNIQFPVLGNMKVAGLTTLQLRDQLTNTLAEKKLVVDPVVTVRQLNFRVSVIGEVGKPTLINVPNEQITLLEALSIAGDITIYGRRDNVTIIRQEKDKKVAKRLDLNSTSLFTSPYYYLKSNDVVYVEPNKARIAGSSRTTQLLPTILSGLSFVAILVGYIINNNN
jgi:polysaccharide biosynthesis/export protein